MTLPWRSIATPLICSSYEPPKLRLQRYWPAWSYDTRKALSPPTESSGVPPVNATELLPPARYAPPATTKPFGPGVAATAVARCEETSVSPPVCTQAHAPPGVNLDRKSVG